jgi:hypothetical protein
MQPLFKLLIGQNNKYELPNGEHCVFIYLMKEVGKPMRNYHQIHYTNRMSWKQFKSIESQGNPVGMPTILAAMIKHAGKSGYSTGSLGRLA